MQVLLQEVLQEVHLLVLQLDLDPLLVVLLLLCPVVPLLVCPRPVVDQEPPPRLHERHPHPLLFQTNSLHRLQLLLHQNLDVWL